jgi:hypothetical protein
LNISRVFLAVALLGLGLKPFLSYVYMSKRAESSMMIEGGTGGSFFSGGGVGGLKSGGGGLVRPRFRFREEVLSGSLRLELRLGGIKLFIEADK